MEEWYGREGRGSGSVLGTFGFDPWSSLKRVMRLASDGGRKESPLLKQFSSLWLRPQALQTMIVRLPYDADGSMVGAASRRMIGALLSQR